MTTIWPPNNPADEPHATVRTANNNERCGTTWCTCQDPHASRCPPFGHVRPKFDSVDWGYSAPVSQQIATRTVTTTPAEDEQPSEAAS